MKTAFTFLMILFITSETFCQTNFPEISQTVNDSELVSLRNMYLFTTLSVEQKIKFYRNQLSVTSKKTSSNRATKQVLDSIIVRGHVNNSPLQKFMKNTYEYDMYGFQTLDLKTSWDNQTSNWKPESQEEFTTNVSGFQTSYTRYYWNNQSNNWYGYQKYSWYYDNNDNLIKNVNFKWDNGQNTWVNKSKSESNFNNNHQITRMIQSRWDSGLWVNYVKDEISYNSNLDMDTLTSYEWDISSNQWVNLYRQVFVFDTSGVYFMEKYYSWYSSSWLELVSTSWQHDTNDYLILIEKTKLDTSTGVWIGVSKTTLTYSSNYHQRQAHRYAWDNSISNWKNSGKWYYDYDQNWNQTQYSSYTWSTTNSAWRGSNRTSYQYDINDNLIADTTYHWDLSLNQWAYGGLWVNTYVNTDLISTEETMFWISNAWVNNLRNEYFYDVNGNKVEKSSSKWDTTVSQWSYLKQFLNTYDSLNNLIVEHTNYWDTINNNWMQHSKYSANYNLSYPISELLIPESYYYYYYYFMINSTVSETYNTNTTQWDTSRVDDYYYSTQNINTVSEISKDKISIYPNPFTNYISFKKSDFKGTATLLIFDIQGRKVLSKQISTNEKVNTETLSKGIYIYSLHLDGEIWKGKLIKQ